jgi:L-fuconolactonase
VIDSHHHVWDLAVRDQPWTEGLAPLRRSFAFADLRPALREGGVTATVLVQTITVPEETPELLALAAAGSAVAGVAGSAVAGVAAEPAVAGVVGWAQLDEPDIADRLAELRSLPGGGALVGIRHQVQSEPDPRWLCRPAVRRGLAAVGAAGLAYDLLVTAEQLPAAVETARALPDVRFVLDHAGNPPADPALAGGWRHDVTELSRAENVTVKLSGLLTRAYPGAVPASLLRSWVDVLLAGFGPDRMMFGSDWPVSTLTCTYGEGLATARGLTSDLSAGERHAVFAGTAARTYRLFGGS